MWRKEDAVPPELRNPPAGSTQAPKPGVAGAAQPASHKGTACVSQGITIKGDVTGSEDLFIDGLIEGKITLEHSGVTVGPNGTVKADIVARELTFRGLAEGKFTAEERIQIWHTARVQGDLKSQRISIEDGAQLRGKVEAGKVSVKVTVDDPAGRGKGKPADAERQPAPWCEGGEQVGEVTWRRPLRGDAGRAVQRPAWVGQFAGIPAGAMSIRCPKEEAAAMDTPVR